MSVAKKAALQKRQKMLKLKTVKTREDHICRQCGGIIDKGQEAIFYNIFQQTGSRNLRSVTRCDSAHFHKECFGQYVDERLAKKKKRIIEYAQIGIEIKNDAALLYFW